MDRLSVKQFLEGYINNGVPIFPSNFPTGQDTCYVFEFDGNTNLRGDLAEAHLSVYSRSNNIGDAEKMSLGLMDELSKVTDVHIGERSVILIRTIGKVADYAGKDENDRYYFLSRYRVLID